MRVVWQRDLHLQANWRSVLGPDFTLVPERWTKLACVDSVTGEERWVANVGDMFGVPVRCGNRVVYLEKSGLVRCFDLETGDEAWARRHAFHSVGRAVESGDGAVLVGGWKDSALASISISDGSVRWQGQPAPTFDVINPVVMNDRAVAVSRSRFKIDFLDRRRGRVVRTIAMPTASPALPHESDEVVPAGGGLAMCRAGVLWHWDPATGEWTAWGKSVSRCPVVAGNTTVVARSRTEVVGYSSDGVEVWATALLASGPVSACVLGTDTIIGGPFGRLAVIDASGRQRLAATVGQRIAGLGRSAADTVLVLGKGTVAAIEVPRG